MKKGILTVAMVSVATTIMFTGCTSTIGNRVAYKNESTSTSLAGSFKSYDGKVKKTISFDSSKTMVFTFDSSCNEGNINAIIIDKDTKETIYDFSSGTSTEIETESDKKYEIVITLDNAKGGNYDLHWEKK